MLKKLRFVLSMPLALSPYFFNLPCFHPPFVPNATALSDKEKSSREASASVVWLLEAHSGKSTSKVFSPISEWELSIFPVEYSISLIRLLHLMDKIFYLWGKTFFLWAEIFYLLGRFHYIKPKRTLETSSPSFLFLRLCTDAFPYFAGEWMFCKKTTPTTKRKR